MFAVYVTPETAAAGDAGWGAEQELFKAVLEKKKHMTHEQNCNIQLWYDVSERAKTSIV